ncbi:hypothetical protein MPLDJ20_120262 [Mesorhizobium plurifarium]|uniref:Uncharacterized protein n=1 Tax=Mesorhizobium plurifarium TaxID=69974 RepID=A0A090ECR8_MESPL|nr:hypothetical protein MPLDJ20_120262 [Mesorhizobium plurifarium]
MPLCLKPERLALRNSVGSAYTFGAGLAPTFQSCLSRPRFFCLRDFGRFPLRRQRALLSPANRWDSATEPPTRHP